MTTASKKSPNISVVVYENNTPPRYYKLNKKLSTFYFSLPYVLSGLLFISVVFISIYFKEIRTIIVQKEPEIIRLLRSQNISLVKKNKELFLLSQELEKKLTDETISNESTSLSLFRTSPGFQDKSQSPIFDITDIQIYKNNSNLGLQFNIRNITKESEKISGYFFVILKNGNSFMFYPFDSVAYNDMQIIFNKGKPFSTSRFRPVELKFNMTENINDVLFKVIIFSRSGDLLLKKIISKKMDI